MCGVRPAPRIEPSNEHGHAETAGPSDPAPVAALWDGSASGGQKALLQSVDRLLHGLVVALEGDLAFHLKPTCFKEV